jgi:hypothetical protein
MGATSRCQLAIDNSCGSNKEKKNPSATIATKKDGHRTTIMSRAIKLPSSHLKIPIRKVRGAKRSYQKYINTVYQYNQLGFEKFLKQRIYSGIRENFLYCSTDTVGCDTHRAFRFNRLEPRQL